MGWASGSEVATPIFKAIKKHVKSAKVRQKLYEAAMDALTDADWDTTDECFGIDPLLDKLIERG